MPANSWAGAGRVGKRGAVLRVPHNHPFTESKTFRRSCTRDGIHQMLIMCLFSLSAVLAPVLIAIYILQHLRWEESPP